MKHIPTDELRTRAREALADTPVLFAYLFGSQVTGHADDESDADIAVYLDPRLSKDERFDAQLDLYDRLAAALRIPFEHADIAQLNEASSLLRYVAMAEGTVIYEQDHAARVAFELAVLQERDDTGLFRRSYRRALALRMLGTSR